MQIINDSQSLVEELFLKEEAVRLRKGGHNIGDIGQEEEHWI